MKNRLIELISGVYCVSLPTDTDRRANAARELTCFGVVEWEWHDGVHAGSTEVRDAILGGEVSFSPPCFRCAQWDCKCENNFLTFPQIAVCLAYRKLWKRICSKAARGRDLYLLCEDDVAFTGRAVEGAGYIAEELNSGRLDRERPLLVRLGWAKGSEHDSTGSFSLDEGKVRMSNPCYLLNAAMAARLLREHRKIEHTVDVFTHREDNRNGGHYSVFPPLAFEHSWSTGRFDSAIFPRKIRSDYLWRNSSFADKVRILLGKCRKDGGRQVRRRYEIRSGLIVLDGRLNEDVSEVRRRISKDFDLAVLGEDGDWLVDRDGVGFVVPEWGVWYEKLSVSSPLSHRIEGACEKRTIFAASEIFGSGASVGALDGFAFQSLESNAMALLRLECSALELS
mgnify:CR=1 FL=1